MPQGYEPPTRGRTQPGLLHRERHDVLVLLGRLLVALLVVPASLGAVLAARELHAELELPLAGAAGDEPDRLAAVLERAEHEPVGAAQELAVEVGAADLGQRDLDPLHAASAGPAAVVGDAAQGDALLGHPQAVAVERGERWLRVEAARAARLGRLLLW